MTLYIPPGYAQVLIRIGFSADPEEMVVTHGVDATAFGAGSAGVASAVSAALRQTGAPFASAGNLLTGFYFSGVTAYYQTTTGAIVSIDNTSVVGTAAGNAVPNNSTFLVKKRTAAGGRRNQGRMYVPLYGVGNTAVGGTGVITGGSVAAMNTAWNDYLAQLSSDNLPMVLFHTPYAGVATPTPTPVTSLQCQSIVATQRRRLRP